MLPPVRVLVTGGHGFVGSHLTRALLAGGARVRCLVRGEALPEALRGLDVEVVRGDLRDLPSLERAVAGVEEVYHLAALTRSLTARRMRDVNAGGTARLVAAALRRGLPGRFVLCSSLAAVGPSEDGRPRTEEEPGRPLTWYGASKAEAERIVLAAAGRLAVTVARPPTVYGPRERDLLSLFRAAARGWRPRLGLGPRTLSLVYAPDLAEGLLALARHAGTSGRAYFLTHEEPVETARLTEEVVRAVGRPTRPLALPASAVRLLARLLDLASQATGVPPLLGRQRVLEMGGAHWVCTSRRATAETGWRATTPLREGLAATVAWYREHGWLPRQPVDESLPASGRRRGRLPGRAR